ncbi:MAG: hypothetical protein AB1916_16055 [Thermodesulfobacteriota bacterium]
MKSYAGLSVRESLKASMEHGAGLDNRCWDELLNAPLPAVLVMSPFRRDVVGRLTGKQVHILGPFIHYANPAMNEEETEAQRRRLGRMLLAFPVHSSHNITFEYSVDRFCRNLERLGKGFDSIVVNVYWKDVLLGKADEYTRRGFEVVSCGHMFDLDFLSRLKTLINLASLTVSNSMTTALGYSLHLGIPHVYLPELLGIWADTPETYAREFTSYHSPRSFDFDTFEKAFGDSEAGITPAQLSIARRYWGFGRELSSTDLAGLFNAIERDWERMHRSPSSAPIGQGRAYSSPGGTT